MNGQICTLCGNNAVDGGSLCKECEVRQAGAKGAELGSSTALPPIQSSEAIDRRAEMLKQTRGVISGWVAPFNSMFLFGGTLVAVFDFLSPRVALLPIAAVIAVLGLVATIVMRRFVAPDLPEGSKFRRLLAPNSGLHRSPILVGSCVLSALMVTGAAWSSAKSADGGVIASKFSAARNAQIQLGMIEGSLSRLEGHAKETNQKLDAVQVALSPLSNFDPWASIVTMNIAAIKAVVSKTPPRSIKNEMGVNALMIPIASNLAAVPEGVSILAGAKVNIDEPGQLWGFPMGAITPRIASLTKKYERGQLLKGTGITQLEATPLAVAVWVQNKEAIDALIKAGASLDAPISAFKDPLAPFEGKSVISTVRKEMVIAGLNEYLNK